jgi:aspartyl-tRNA(Asn)/glutamyl-tRNA(Gln) amidotransferase subunit A
VGRIDALAQRFLRAECGPEEIAVDSLVRARQSEAQAIFTQLTPSLAQQQAAGAGRRYVQGRPLGPMDGIPVTWKDLFDVAGTPTTCGSLLTDTAPAAQDASCVALLAAAGAVSIGKTNLSEFAFSGLGINPHFGTPVQQAPKTGVDHLVGGSSSGAAAAMRLNIGCVALGTDTSGSIRVPAAYSGLVGFRPSTGRYPGSGVARLAPSMDTVGTIAHTVADIICVDSVLHVHEQTAIATTVAPRFVLVENFCGETLQPEVRMRCLSFVSRLRNVGFRCEQRRIGVFDAVLQAFDRHGTLVSAEAGYELARYCAPGSLACMDPFVRHRLIAARAMPAYHLVALLRARESAMLEIAGSPSDQIYVFPTTPTTAPALRCLRTMNQIAAANRLALRHTMPGSFLDMPSIAVPSGCDAVGLSTSVLLSCHQGGDEMLLAVAQQLESMDLFRL